MLLAAVADVCWMQRRFSARRHGNVWILGFN